MVKNMQPGSIIYDLAAVQGGNTAFTEVDKIIEKNGVKIMGESNILNKLPVSASSLYAKNIFNFVKISFFKSYTTSIFNIYCRENNHSCFKNCIKNFEPFLEDFSG